jgi:DNA-binding winged helix-turn-helix (wHTH) protein/tetratricopeptide (TPR) repeat protein/TolB-like protein
MKRPAEASVQMFRFGLFELDTQSKTLAKNGLRVKVQEQPLCVLAILLERAGEIVTRDELRQRLWPDGTFVDFEGSLYVILKRLRTVLADDPENPRFIETVPRRGYRFIAPVTKEGGETTAIPAVSPNAAVREVLAPASQRGWGKQRHFLAYALLTLFVIGLVLSLQYFRKRSTPANSSKQETPTTVAMRRSLAVLGFRNLSDRASDAWLTTGLAEMLSTELAAGNRLRLVPGEDVANLRQSSPWPQTDTLAKNTTARIGNVLNCDVLVLGSFSSPSKPGRQGQIRVDARLQDTRTGEIIAEIAEIGSTDRIFPLISSIGARLREKMGVSVEGDLPNTNVAAALPSNPEAIRFYSLGLAKLREFDAEAAKELFLQAIAAEPNFPLSHSMLSNAWGQLGYAQKHKEEAKRALDLSANLPRVSRMIVEADYRESLSDHEGAASIYRALFALFSDNIEFGLRLAALQLAAGHDKQAGNTLHQLRQLPAPFSDDPRIDLAEADTVEPRTLALGLVKRAEQKAQVQGKRLVYAQARRNECLSLIYSKTPDQAAPVCDDAYSTFLSAGNRAEAADCVRIIADHEGDTGQYDLAIANYERALSMLQESGARGKTGAILNNMAINYANEGKLGRAEQLYRQAKTIFDEVHDKRNSATAIVNIADIYYARGKLAEAATAYQQCNDIENTLDRPSPGYALFRLADLEWTQGQLALAHRHAELALASLRPSESGYQYLTAAMLVLGEVLQSEGDLEGARRQYEESLEIRKRQGEMQLIAENQMALAQLALDENQPSQAAALLPPAIAAFEKEHASPDLTSATTLLSRALLEEGKFQEANDALKRASEAGRNMEDPALRLPLAIQSARMQVANSEQSEHLQQRLSAMQQLQATVATSRKLGYYQVEMESRLALAELEIKGNLSRVYADLESLQKEARERGLQLVVRRAEALASQVSVAKRS